MIKELQLIDAAKAGSADAFADLVLRYRDRLLRFLLTRCASYADAEDALQDTLINAYRYLHSYDPRWRFSTWLYRIAIRNAQKIAVLVAAAENKLAIEAKLVTTESDMAQSMASVVRGLIGLASFSDELDAEAIAVLQGTRVEVDGNELSISLAIDPALLVATISD